MSLIPVVSSSISVLSCLVGGGVIWKLIDVGRQSGRVEQRVFNLEERSKEDRAHDAEKFDRLYEGRNEANERLIRIETLLNQLLDEMKKKG